MDKKKNIFIVIIIIFISIGFAYLSSRLDINGIANINKIKWNIYFDNVVKNFGEEFEVTAPTTGGTNTKEINFEVALEDPGDSYSFDVDIVNNGTIDAMYSISIDNTVLTENQRKLFIFDVKYSDGEELEENNKLAKMSKDTITVTISYNKDIDISDLPSVDSSVNYTLTLTYIQANTQGKFADDRSTTHFDVLDLSGKGNHGILQGNYQFNRNGSITLNGSSYINAGLDNYDFKKSISIVIKCTINGYHSDYKNSIIGNWEAAGGGIELYYGKIKSNLNINGNYYDFLTDYSVTIGTTYTIVLTYDGAAIKMYVNGEEIPNTNGNYSVDVVGNIKPSTESIIVAGNPNSDGNVVDLANINVSNVLIFDRTLTEEEISTDYTLNISPTDKNNLILYYDFK